MAEAAGIAHDVLAMIGYGNEPAVLVLADSDAAGERARGAVEQVGARVRAIAPVARGLDLLDEQLAPDALWLELDYDPGDALDRLLDRLGRETRATRFGVVVSAPPELIDVVAARLLQTPAELLCDPTEQERIEGITAALNPPSARFHDVNRGANGRLQQISEEVGRIANILAELSEEESAPAPAAERAISASTIRAIIRARRLRDRFFASDLFADPAWDMMLDLMAARLENRRVAVSSLCIAAAVPPTTALRWIKTLTESGVFTRAADPEDGRRVYVELSATAATAFEGYLRAASRLGALSI